MRGIAVVQHDDFFRVQATDDLWRVAGGDELDFGEGRFQGVDDITLPLWMQMDVQLVNDDDARSIFQHVLAHMWIEDTHAAGDIGDQCDEAALAVAKTVEWDGFPCINNEQETLES